MSGIGFTDWTGLFLFTSVVGSLAFVIVCALVSGKGAKEE